MAGFATETAVITCTRAPSFSRQPGPRAPRTVPISPASTPKTKTLSCLT